MIKPAKGVASFALALSVAALTACGGGGGGMSSALPKPASTPYDGPAGLKNFSWGQSYLNGAAYVGPAHFDTMGLNVGVTMRDSQGLVRYAQMVSDPKSASYRHFLTPVQIADRFGASQQQYAAAAKYFAGAGLHVGGWPQREMLFVSGSQTALETAFGTKFGLYEKNGVRFIAPSGQPHFQQAVPVAAVTGLVHVTPVRSYIEKGVPGRAGTNNFLGYSPAQIQNAFDFSGAYSSGFDGTGITVGIIGTGPFSPADVPAFARFFKARAAVVTQAPVTDSGEAAGLAKSGIPTPPPNGPSTYADFGLATPPPVTAPCNASYPATSMFPTASCNPEDGETQLDTEQIATLAPGSGVSYYLAFNPADCASSSCDSTVPGAIGAQGLAIADDEIQQAIADNTADILSLSFGGGEADFVGFYYDSAGNGFEPVEFATLASEGIAVFVSSGDAGAEECSSTPTAPCVSYPAGDVNVVSVGGATVPVDTWGQFTGQVTAWGAQTAEGFAGSGGGISGIFPAPAWQSATVPGATRREQPDVSLIGDSATGVAMLGNAFDKASEGLGPVGGTSVAAPEMAAMWALVLHACSKAASCATATGGPAYRLGNPAPLLYGIYGNAANAAKTYLDVTYGTTAQTVPGATPGPNGLPPLLGGCCQAGKGYDLASGIGVPFAGHLIDAVVAGQNVP